MTDFTFSIEDLKALIRDRNDGSIEILERGGGVCGLCEGLRVSPQVGLASDPMDLEARQQKFGVNYVPPKKPQSYWDFLKAAFADFTIIMLCGAALISVALAIFVEKTATAYAEGIAILFSIILVTNVAATNDWKKQKQFLILNAVVEDIPILTKRDGEFKDVPVKQIVVGDIVAIRVGDLLCADGVFVEGHSVNTDESALTGEPKLITKSKTKPFLLSGTKVMEGTGSFVVTAVGEHSESGQIKALITGRKLGTGATENAENDEKKEEEVEEKGEEKSVLTAKLDRMAIIIGKLGLTVSAFCVLIMTIRFCITRYALEDWDTQCALVLEKSCDEAEVKELSGDPEKGYLSCFSSEYLYLRAAGGEVVNCCEDYFAELHEEIVMSSRIRGTPCGWLDTHLGEFLQFFITGITILVVAIPEGLPLAVTLSLAFSVVKMQDDKNLVKHLDACETMGSATTICSDKTGTLTKNKMTVMRAYMAGKEYAFDGKQSCGTLAKESSEMGQRYIDLLTHGIALNSTASIKWNNETSLWDQLGNKTEAALLGFAYDLGSNYKDIRDGDLYAFTSPEGLRDTAVHMFPFSSARKRSGIVVDLAKLPNEAGGYRLFMKGASEIVLSLCTEKLDKDGQSVSPLTEDCKKTLNDDVIHKFAQRAMRTICMAYRDFPKDQELDWEKETDAAGTGQSETNVDSTFAAETQLTLLALVGIEDPLRDEVPAAIAQCRAAGVDVRMVTGDNLDTAVAISKGCGILRPGDDLDRDGNPKPNAAMTGPYFRNYVTSKSGKIDQSKFDEIWPHLRVLARSSPTDKYILVTGLNESELYATKEGLMLGIYPDRQVIAVTGDGTNDAPALKRADVGFAMGLTGTEVAKDAADIILMDDNFSSIVKACKWGRNVYDSIAKFLQFQLTVNLVAVSLSAIGAVRSSESPLKAVQMLWVNLIMDSFASIALATEPPTDELLKRPPYGRNRTLISAKMKFNMFGQATYQLIVCIIILFSGPSIWGFPDGSGQGHLAPPSIHYTFIFNSFVQMQLFNQISCRKLYHEFNLLGGVLNNSIFLVILLIEFAFQIVIVEYGGIWFKTRSLPVEYWIWSLVLGAGSWPWQYFIIFFARLIGVRNQSDANKSNRSYVATVPEGGVVDAKMPSDENAMKESGRISSKVVAGLAQMSSRSIGGIFDTPSEEKMQQQLGGGYKNNKRAEMNNAIVKQMSSYGSQQNEKMLRQASKDFKS